MNEEFLELVCNFITFYWNLTMDSQLRYVYGMILEVATLKDNPQYWLAFNHTNMHVIES